VINRSTGYFCLSLLLILGVPAVRAQQPETDPAAAQAPTQQAPTQQAPTQPAPAPQNPLTQQEPSTPSAPIVQAPPELPKYPDVRLPGEYGFWISINGSDPREQPIFDKGHASTFTQSGYVVMQGHPKAAEGAEIGIALGLHNALRLSYFRDQAQGNFTNGVELVVPGQDFAAGNYLSTSYTLQRYKASFDYLTWPYPVESRRFRLMTLWQFEYMTMKTAFNAPLLPLTDANGNPYIGADGNPISYASQISKSIISPELGIGLREYLTKNFRLELNGTGFAIPHHWTIWEADVTANIRIKQFEVGFGAKAFHFKTSPEQDFFSRATLASPFVSIKWFSQ
jgi:hypothetical protein